MPANASLAGRKVALAVCGSIAAYKAVEVARLLMGEGVAVTPIMSRSAGQFLGPLTLAGICGAAVIDDMFDPRYPGEVHVAVGSAVDAVLVVPATADVLARLSAGRADDVITALLFVHRGARAGRPGDAHAHVDAPGHPAQRRTARGRSPHRADRSRCWPACVWR